MSLAKVRAGQRRALDGAWVTEDVHEYEGVAFRVRGWMNPEFLQMRDKLSKAVPRSAYVDGDIPPDEQKRIIDECIVETVLLDWRGPGMAEEDGAEPVAYSKERAREFLRDPLLGPWRGAVVASALKVAKDGRDSIEDDTKN